MPDNGVTNTTPSTNSINIREIVFMIFLLLVCTVNSSGTYERFAISFLAAPHCSPLDAECLNANGRCATDHRVSLSPPFPDRRHRHDAVCRSPSRQPKLRI